MDGPSGHSKTANADLCHDEQVDHRISLETNPEALPVAGPSSAAMLYEARHGQLEPEALQWLPELGDSFAYDIEATNDYIGDGQGGKLGIRFGVEDLLQNSFDHWTAFNEPVF